MVGELVHDGLRHVSEEEHRLGYLHRHDGRRNWGCAGAIAGRQAHRHLYSPAADRLPYYVRGLRVKLFGGVAANEGSRAPSIGRFWSDNPMPASTRKAE